MNSELNESTYDSLRENIQTYYGIASTDGSADTQLTKQTIAKFSRSFTHEFKEGDKYVLDEKQSTGIYQFFTHETDKSRKVLRIESPYEDKPSLLIELPKTPTSEKAKSLITHWEDMKEIVMFDQEAFEILYDIAAAYRTKDPFVHSGPPAKSKTFMLWVFACMIEAPYDRISCTEGTDEEQLKGASGNEVKDFGIFSVEELFSQGIINFQIERALNEYRQAYKTQNFGERYFQVSSFLQSIQTLMDLDQSLFKASGKHLDVTDNALIPLYSIIQDFTKISLIRTREFGFIDSSLVLLTEYGGICVLDEFDRIKKENVQVQLHPYMEPDTEVITVDTQRKPQHIRRHPDAWITITMNHVKDLPPTIESRARRRKSGPVSRQYIVNIMKYYFTGNDPDIWVKSKRVKGRAGMRSKLREMEKMPYRDEFINAVVDIYTGIIKLAQDHKIGQDKKNKSFVQFDQRTIGMLANELLANFNSQHVIKNGKIVKTDPDWYRIATGAVENIFLAGMSGDVGDEKSDRDKVYKLIHKQKVFKNLEALSAGKSKAATEKVKTTQGTAEAPTW